jgi:hypothetical protein
MAIVANQTTITLDASSVGCVRSFSVPAGVVKEVDVTCLTDSIETFQASTLQEAQEFTFTIILDPAVNALEAGTSGTWEITFPLDNPVSTTNASWSFDGFVRDAGTVDGEYTSDSPLEQTVTVRLSTIVTKIAES